jgi:undecaprenyl-diphosphatase
MTGLEALILGLVEGLTEFLPVSSTGHLILVRDVLGLQVEEGLAIDAVLNMAAVAAVLLYFFRDIVRIVEGAFRRDRAQTTLLVALILGTVPGAVLGFLFENVIATALRSSLWVAAGLVAGSIFFTLAERYAGRAAELTAGKGFAIGFFQALALIPGMSRSGMSIVGGLLMGLSREQATRFAFLLSAPLIFGAGLKSLIDLRGSGVLQDDASMIALAALTAFVSGFAAIHFMLKFLRTHSLMPFVWYRLALAAAIVLIAVI